METLPLFGIVLAAAILLARDAVEAFRRRWRVRYWDEVVRTVGPTNVRESREKGRWGVLISLTADTGTQRVQIDCFGNGRYKDWARVEVSGSIGVQPRCRSSSGSASK